MTIGAALGVLVGILGRSLLPQRKITISRSIGYLAAIGFGLGSVLAYGIIWWMMWHQAGNRALSKEACLVSLAMHVGALVGTLAGLLLEYVRGYHDHLYCQQKLRSTFIGCFAGAAVATIFVA